MFLFILLDITFSKTLEDFNTPFFEPKPDEGLYEVTVGLEQPGLILAAYGHFDNDKYCDIAILNT